MQNLEKIEKRFQRGIIHQNDIRMWISGNSPKEVYQRMQDSWEAFHVERPGIKVVYKSDLNNLREGEYVSLEIKEIKDVKRLLEKIGQRVSADNLLRSIIATKYTGYIASCLNPGNFVHEFSFCQPETCTEKNFYNYVSIYSQSAAIGEIGSRIEERHSGIYDPVMDYGFIKVDFEEVENRTKINLKNLSKRGKKVLKKFGLGQISVSQLKDPKEKLREIEEIRPKVLDSFLTAAIIGTGRRFVADDLEKEYDGKLPQLIRKDLEPREECVEQFETFTEKHMPTFRRALQIELSLMKE